MSQKPFLLYVTLIFKCMCLQYLLWKIALANKLENHNISCMLHLVLSGASGIFFFKQFSLLEFSVCKTDQFRMNQRKKQANILQQSFWGISVFRYLSYYIIHPQTAVHTCTQMKRVFGTCRQQLYCWWLTRLVCYGCARIIYSNYKPSLGEILSSVMVN